MPDNLGYLFAAFIVIWIGLFGYLIVLSSQVRQLRDEVRLLKEAMERLRERET